MAFESLKSIVSKAIDKASSVKTSFDKNIALPVGGAIVGTVKELGKIGGNALSTVAGVKDSEVAAQQNRESLNKIDQNLIAKPTAFVNQKILQPLGNVLTTGEYQKPTVVGSTLKGIGNFIEGSGKNIGIGKVYDTVESGSQKIADTTVDGYQGNKALGVTTGLATIGLGALQATPFANILSGMVANSSNESGLTQKIQSGKGELIKLAKESGLNDTNAENAVDLVVNGASLFFGAKGAKQASKLGKVGAAEAKVQSNISRNIGPIKTTVDSLKSTSGQSIPTKISTLKTDLANAKTLREIVAQPKLTAQLNKAAEGTVTKGDLAKNALFRTSSALGYTQAGDAIPLLADYVANGDKQPQEETTPSVDPVQAAGGLLLSTFAGNKAKKSSKKSKASTTIDSIVDETVTPKIDEPIVTPKIDEPTPTINKVEEVNPIEPTPPIPKNELVEGNIKKFNEMRNQSGDLIGRNTGILEIPINAWQKAVAYLDTTNSWRTLLDNFSIGKGNEKFGRYIEGQKVRDRYGMAKSIVDTPEVNTITDIAKLGTKTQLSEKDLVGAKGATGKSFDAEDAKIQYETLTKDIDTKINETSNPLLQKGYTKKDIKNMWLADATYSLFKENPEMLNKYLTPEQIEAFKKFDTEDYNKIVTTTTKSGQELGFLPETFRTDGSYTHLVTTLRAAIESGKKAKKEGKQEGKIEIDMGNGNVIRADTLEDAIRIENFLRNKGSAIDPEAFSALTKNQAGQEYDPYRIGGKLNSTLSFADNVGRLYSDKNTMKSIDNLLEKGDKNYTAPIRDSVYTSLAKEVLGIRGSETRKEGIGRGVDKTLQAIGDQGRFLTMAGNIKNIATTAVPSTIKAGYGMLFDQLASVATRGRANYLKGITSPEVDAKLQSLGAVNEFNLDNASPLGKLNDKLMYVSYGTWYERPLSKVVALSSMESSLRRAGKLGNAKDASGVIDAWNKWEAEGSKDFYEARSAMDTSLLSQGKTDAIDKPNIPLANAISPVLNATLGSLKSWSLGQLAANKSAVNDIARSIYSKVTKQDVNSRDFEMGLKTLTGNFATYYALGLAVKTGLEAMGDIDQNDNEDLKKKVVKSITDSLYYNPLTPQLYGLYESLRNGAISNSVFKKEVTSAINLMQAVISAAGGDKAEAKINFQDALGDLFKIGVIKNASDITGILNDGKSLQDIVSSKAGTFSKNEATRTGVASGINYQDETDYALKAFGVDPQQARLNALHSIRDGLNAPDWATNTLGGVILWKALEKEVRAITSEFGFEPNESGNGFTIPMDERVKAQYVFDTTNTLNDSKDAADFLSRMNLTEAGTGISTLMGKLATSNVTSNKKANDALQYLAVNGINNENFIPKMNEMKSLDPYLYNNIISMISQFKKTKEDLGGATLTNESINSSIADMLSKPGKSTSREDYAISQANNDNAITTAYTQLVGTDFKSANSDLEKGKVEDARKKLNNLNELTKVVNSPSLSNYKNAFGNMVANNVDTISSVVSALGVNFLESYPELAGMLNFGLRSVRGGRETAPATVATTTPTVGGSSISTTPSSVPATAPIGLPKSDFELEYDKPLKLGATTLAQLDLGNKEAKTQKQGFQTLSMLTKQKGNKTKL